jgi:glycosyltransferase involved in cell wall biosynthesis
MTKILYLSATRNTHDQKLIEALSYEFNVTAVTEMKTKGQFYKNRDHFDLVVYTPLNLDVPWSKIGFDYAYGLCMAFEINEMDSNEIGVISKNVQISNAINIDNAYVLKKFREIYGHEHFVTNFKYGCDIQKFFKEVNSSRYKPIRIICNRSWNEVHQNIVVFEALDLLLKNNIDFQCTFIEDPPANADLDSKYQDLFKSDKIKFLTKLNVEEMANLLENSDIYVSASRSDGTSVSLMEAMACGKIVVTTDFPANLDLIATGYNGFTFRIGDAFELCQTIIQILNKDDMELFIIKERAQKKVIEMCDWSIESQKLVASVYSLIKSKENYE